MVALSDRFNPFLQILAPLGVALLLAALFFQNLRRQKLQGLPPYDMYAEPFRYWLTQGIIASLALAWFAGFAELALQWLGFRI